MDKRSRKNDSVDQTSPFNRYFSDSGGNGSNFFDEISSSTNVSAMMTSVVGSGSSSDLFGSSSKPMTSPKQQTLLVSPEGALANNTQVQLSESDQLNKEPIVCRIFSDQQEAVQPLKISKLPDKMYFDTLGSSHQSFPLVDSIRPGPRPTLDLFSSASGCGVIGSDFALDPFKASYALFGKTPGVIEQAEKRESERSRDAWIPSERTRKALISFATAPPGTYTHERELLTMPGVVLEEDMVDNVSQVVTHFLGEAEASKRKVLTMNDVTQDERGLRELIQAECFRAAVNLTGRLLTIYGQGEGRAGNPSKHTVHSIQLWFTRLSLLVKLRAFSVADAEASVWWDFDHPDLYFQFYREMYGGRLGSLVPFQFRLLIATLPAHLQRHQEALDRLYSILATVRKVVKLNLKSDHQNHLLTVRIAYSHNLQLMLRNLEQGRAEDGSQLALSDTDRAESKKLWRSREARVLHAIVNVALQMKDYSLAIEVLRGMIECDESEYQKRPLHSVLGRIFLQLGDVNEAESCFSTARSHNEIIPTVEKVTDLVDQGLVAIGRNSFPEAYQFFLEASKLDPGNIMVLNNMAVCQLYMCNLKEALRLLSDGIRQWPKRALHESLLLNTATLYELHTQSATSKLELLHMVSQYMGDATCVSCLKLKT